MTSPPPTTPSRTARIVAIVAVALLAVVGVGAFFVFTAIGSLGTHTSSRGTGHLEVAGHGAGKGQTTVSCAWTKYEAGGYVELVSSIPLTGDFPLTVIVFVEDQLDSRVVITAPFGESDGVYLQSTADRYTVQLQDGGRSGSATFSASDPSFPTVSGSLTWSCEEGPVMPAQ